MIYSLLIAYAITFGMQNKAIFLRNRHSVLDKMLHCTYCTGFHAGWITYLVFVSPFWLNHTIDTVPSTIGFALASATFSYGLDTLIRLMESHADPIEVPDEDSEQIEDEEEDGE